jgi:hypothetical protein
MHKRIAHFSSAFDGLCATQAWDLYYHVFKRINKQLHSMTTLELQYVAPALVRTQGMELAVPGEHLCVCVCCVCVCVVYVCVCVLLW